MSSKTRLNYPSISVGKNSYGITVHYAQRAPGTIVRGRSGKADDEYTQGFHGTLHLGTSSSCLTLSAISLYSEKPWLPRLVDWGGIVERRKWSDFGAYRVLLDSSIAGRIVQTVDGSHGINNELLRHAATSFKGWTSVFHLIFDNI